MLVQMTSVVAPPFGFSDSKKKKAKSFFFFFAIYPYCSVRVVVSPLLNWALVQEYLFICIRISCFGLSEKFSMYQLTGMQS
ncbi:hypothetical protein CROQUDRAFT_295523 [Cronartium quercuum f. sp. fusiforme G11]|uniref:Uncharacterized protein n=1 Tax=Cronartium quercuum f. sp. fusiforme G11 TaxID=708437 RepID=A0A9P6NC55_9BASI|nr:hypothetical protein CROQUDRAFT_295523 [Cronartium quercuum f. sp. fusiforme G11]